MAKRCAARRMAPHPTMSGPTLLTSTTPCTAMGQSSPPPSASSRTTTVPRAITRPLFVSTATIMWMKAVSRCLLDLSAWNWLKLAQKIQAAFPGKSEQPWYGTAQLSSLPPPPLPLCAGFSCFHITSCVKDYVDGSRFKKLLQIVWN